ncbi:MAG TPA: DegQ family serine endoprotease [Pseudomonadales bacterium]
MSPQRMMNEFCRSAGTLLAVWIACLVSVSALARELPDFTRLVEQNAAAVVNISSVRRIDSPESDAPRSRSEELDEFFRRFFPPERGGSPPPYLRPRSLGSGFVLADGYILTNNHVVEEADEIVVRFSDRRELNAELIGADPRSDLALLKVEATNLPSVRLGDSEKLKVGEWVLAIGSPFGFDYSVTAGIVSAKGRSLPTELNENYVPYLQTDVAINPGNSGGPLFNLDGEVIGINSQIYSNSGGFMGVSFAIPINVAMEVVAQLKETGYVARGWLGVMIQDVDKNLAEALGLDRPRGALISRVLEGSPAEAGGILEQDIITAINDHPIDFSSELPHFVGRIRPGANATLDVIRNGEEIEVALEIGEAPERGDPVAATRTEPGGASRLGMTVEAVPETVLERLSIAGGVRVTEATGSALESGIRPGDIITKLDNRAVTDAQSFFSIADGLESGRSVAVLVIRGQSPLFLALRVPE